jgi:glutamyl-tRNA synthetase
MAVLSLMARLGSSDPVELRRSVEEVVAGFRLDSFGAAPTKFDAEDLWPLTQRVLAGKPASAMAPALTRAGVPEPLHAAFWTALHENVAREADIAAWWRVLSQGGAGTAAAEDRDFVAEALRALPEPPYTAETWGEWTSALKASSGRKGKGLFQPLRRLVTGRDSGPEMAALMPLLQTKPSLAEETA